MIVEAGAQSCYVDYAPSFGRGPFGHYICTAVNDAVLHGLPHDYALADGDLLTLDLAVSKGGVAADSAISFIVGESEPPESVAMISATERALSAGIAVAGPGARIGDISHAIGVGPERGRVPDQHRVRRSRHRIDDAPGPACSEQRSARTRLHAAPRAAAGAGTLGHGGHRQSSSPIPTAGRSAARRAARTAHSEHTIAITDDGAEILTLPTQARTA